MRRVRRVRVYGPRQKVPPADKAVNTTSKSAEAWSREFSPFTLGPVGIFPGTREVTSAIMENAWQYSKVYKSEALANGDPAQLHAVWASQGWRNPVAVRFPKGRGAKPLYSIHRNQRLGYIAARLYIYIPAYVEALCVSPEGRAAFTQLKAEYESCGGLALFDYDGYDHVAAGLDFAGVQLNERKKAGHAFILAALLEGDLVDQHADALARCAEAAALAAAGLPAPRLPDLSPARAEERWAETGYFERRDAMGRLGDVALRGLAPGGERADVEWQGESKLEFDETTWPNVVAMVAETAGWALGRRHRSCTVYALERSGCQDSIAIPPGSAVVLLGGPCFIEVGGQRVALAHGTLAQCEGPAQLVTGTLSGGESDVAVAVVCS